MENQKCCTAAFLDVSQAFDKVGHPELPFKIKRILPSSYVGKSISELQIQVETHVFELSAGNCHR